RAQVREVLELDPAPAGLRAGRAAERRAPLPVAGRLVHLDAPGPDLVHEPEGAPQARRKDRRLEAEVRVVGERDRLVVTPERGDREHRPEGLLAEEERLRR